MSKKKKSILKSRFYRVYFAVVALLLIAIVAGTLWLRGVLADYESAQPVYVAEDVAKLFEEKDYQRIYELDTSAGQIAEGDKAFYLESMADITRGKTVAWSEAFSADKDERRYSVTLDGERFATFTLVPSGQTTPKGNRLWTLGEVTTLVTRREPDPTPEPTVPEATPEPEEPEQMYDCRLTAPAGYMVTLDGVRLNEGNVRVTYGQMFEEGFLPEDVQNPSMATYEFSTSTDAPNFVVTDENGEPVALTASTERERTWSCGLHEDEVLKDKYGASATKLGKTIAKFMSKDSSKRGIKALCLPGSPAEEIFSNLSNTFATPHSGASFRNESLTEFYRLSDECFTCRVSFDYVLKTKDGERVYPTAYTFCLLNKDGKGGLYNLQIY